MKEGIIFLLSKFGNLPWMDAPFHVALARNLTHLQNIEEGQGYGLNSMLIDSSKGEILALRYIGLGTKFSRELKKQIELQDKDDFDAYEYDLKLLRIYNTYPTRDMVNYSIASCRIRQRS